MTDRAVKVAEELASAFPVRNAAKILRFSTNAMYVAVTKGRIRVLRVGWKLYIPAAEIERILLAAEDKTL